MWDNERNGTPTTQTENVQLRSLQPANGAAVQRGMSTRRRKTNHEMQCNGCVANIVGERYACLHCSGNYNLVGDLPCRLDDSLKQQQCAECENMSYILHDPLHIFLKLDNRLQEPGLRGMGETLPILYKIPAGNSVIGGDNTTHAPSLHGPSEYLSTIRHQKVVCDRCMEPVLGKWFRCVNLAGSYDLCSACEPSDSHKGEHIYLVIKSIVDMDLFADVAQIGSYTGKALLPGLTYAGS